jgi:hypothetical protein
MKDQVVLDSSPLHSMTMLLSIGASLVNNRWTQAKDGKSEKDTNLYLNSGR